MQYRKDPKTGNDLSILGFGCMRLPSNVTGLDQKKCDELFQSAIDQGINYFDTAYIYRGSEAALGSFLSRTKQHEKIHLATKLPLLICRKPEDFDKYLNTQLQRLQTDSIEYYFMHMITGPEQWNKLRKLGIEDWIKEKQAEGKIKQVGFSYHGKQDDFAEVLSAYDWDFCQIQYNYRNTHYQAGRAGLQLAAQKGIPVFIMEPLLGGTLVNSLPDPAKKAFAAADSDQTPAGWAFNWIWDQPEPTVVLSGMNSLEQLNENCALADKAYFGMLSAEHKQTYHEVVEHFNNSYKVTCTGCNYCMPCPQGVDIPACFMTYNNSYAISRFAGIRQYITGMSVLSEKPAFASRCIQCGVCESKCPQNIEIMQNLTQVSKRLEPWWFKAGANIARKLTSPKTP